MKSSSIYLPIICLVLVLWTGFFIIQKTKQNQYEEIHAQLTKRNSIDFQQATDLGSAGSSENLMMSLETVRHLPRVDTLTKKLHAAAVQEFFRIAGIRIDSINPEYYYNVTSDTDEWVTLSGESENRNFATIVVAAKVRSPDELVKLIEKRWKIPKQKWRRLPKVKVAECSSCEAYEFTFEKQQYTLIIGKSETSDLVHAVAEISDGSEASLVAQKLADRLHFSISNDF